MTIAISLTFVMKTPVIGIILSVYRTNQYIGSRPAMYEMIFFSSGRARSIVAYLNSPVAFAILELVSIRPILNSKKG